MTVSNTNRKDVHVTNGVTVYWPYTFQILTTDGSDLALYETNIATGAETLIEDNLTKDIANSRIKYPRTGAARPTGYKITVARVTPRTQGTSLSTQSFDPKNMERGLDKITAIAQEVDEIVSRAAVAAISEEGVNFSFPAPVGGQVVGWKADGSGMQNYPNTAIGLESAIVAAAEAATEAAEDATTAITGILEPDGTTVKKATHAVSAENAILTNLILMASLPETTLLGAANTPRQSSVLGPSKLKEIKMNYPGSIRVKVTFKPLVLGKTVYGRICINEEPASTYSTAESMTIYESYDNLSKNDLIQFYGVSSSESGIEVSEFEVHLQQTLTPSVSVTID